MTETTAAAPLKVAIIGTAPMSKMLAPYDDPSWQIWACSGGNINQLPRVSIWFEMHFCSVMMAPENRPVAEPLYAYLKEKSDAGVFQVVMPEAGTEVGGTVNKYVPKAAPYPLDDMIKRFGTRNWFTSSVAYMMALAIARGAQEIALFGVDMAADMEHYSAQRAGCTFWIEKATAEGIKITVPFESCVNTPTPLYGYSEAAPFGRRLAVTAMTVRQHLNNAQNELARQRDLVQYFSGALEQINYFERTWTDGTELEVDLGAFSPEAIKAAAEKASRQREEATLFGAVGQSSVPSFVPDSGLERSYMGHGGRGAWPSSFTGVSEADVVPLPNPLTKANGVDHDAAASHRVEGRPLE